jgi:hypothetical protein
MKSVEFAALLRGGSWGDEEDFENWVYLVSYKIYEYLISYTCEYIK